MASLLASDLHALLECALCFERYRNPKLLACGHTFCGRPCLEDLLKSQDNKHRQHIPCPLCRKIMSVQKGIDNLPPDIKVVQMMDILKTKENLSSGDISGAHGPCGICKHKNGAAFCPECRLRICNDCLEDHRGTRHITIELEDLKMCDVHNEPCTHHCSECVKTVCYNCTISSTNCMKHSTQSLQKVLRAPNYSYIPGIEYELQEKLKHNNVMNLQTKESINKQSETLVSWILTKQEDMLNEVDFLTGRIKQEIIDGEQEKLERFKTGHIKSDDLKFLEKSYIITQRSLNFVPSHGKSLGTLKQIAYDSEVFNNSKKPQERLSQTKSNMTSVARRCLIHSWKDLYSWFRYGQGATGNFGFTADIDEYDNVRIISVEKGSPAEAGGLRVDDRVDIKACIQMYSAGCLLS